MKLDACSALVAEVSLVTLSTAWSAVAGAATAGINGKSFCHEFILPVVAALAAKYCLYFEYIEVVSVLLFLVAFCFLTCQFVPLGY